MKNKAVCCLILCVIWLMSSSHTLAADAIVLRASVTPKDAWVGQKVILHVDVLARDGWVQLKKVADAEVDGAYLLRLETQGTRLSETIDGDSYTGQRYEFLLFAQRAGKLRIPPVAADAEVRTWGAAGGTVVERVTLPAVEFAARTPPGAEGLRGLISTSELAARQEWEPETDRLQVGDAIQRRITLRADDVSGMAFVPLRHEQLEHLGVYPAESTVEDNFARGNLTGTRIETVTYVVERAGEFEIPDIELSWWDVDRGELKQIVLPGRSLQVSGNTTEDLGTVETPAGQDKKWLLWTTVLAALAAVFAAVRFGGRMVQRWKTWRSTRDESEARYFQRALRSVRAGDRNAALRDTMRWLDRIDETSRPARLDQFFMQYGSDQFREDVLDWENATAAELAGVLAAARTRWQRAQRGKVQARGLLPELNG